jgi:hypothetical protein
MLNNNNNFLKSRSGSYAKDEDNNGKARCFVCKKEHCYNIVKEDDDYLSLYLRYRNYFLKAQILDKNLSSNPNTILHNNIINIHSNNNTLQKPCECDKQVHPLCLLRYCLMNLSFQCGKCKSFFVFNFYKEQGNTDFSIYFFTFLFCSLLIAIYLLSALCFANAFKVTSNLLHYTYILGVLFFILAIALTVYSFSYFKNLYISSFTGADLGGMTKDGNNSTKELSKEKLGGYFNFLVNKHKIGKLDLFEKKMNNMIFQETLLKEEMKLQRFIIDNNNSYHRSIGGLDVDNGKDGYLKIDIDKKFKFGVPGNETINEPFKQIGRQKSVNSQNNNKPPIEKSASLKRNQTKESRNSSSSENKDEVDSLSIVQKQQNKINLNLHEIKEEDHQPRENHSRNASDKNLLILNNNQQKRGSSNVMKKVKSDRSFASQHSINTSEANLLPQEDKELLPKEKMTHLNKIDKGKAQTIIESKEMEMFKNIDFETGNIDNEEKSKKKKGKSGVDIKLNKQALADKQAEYFSCDVILQ